MKLKSYLLAGLATLALSACNEDFGDWQQQATNSQGATVSFGPGSVTEVGVIDFAEIAADEPVKVCTIVPPTSSLEDATVSYKITLGEGDAAKTYTINADGTMAYNDLKSFVEGTYGKAPKENVINAVITQVIGEEATKTRFVSDVFNVTAKPDAPWIDPAGYYVVGSIDEWTCTRKEAYFMSNGGGDVYEKPEFSVTLEGLDGVVQFKVVPSSAFDSNGTMAAGNWDIALSGLDADPQEGMEGHFSYNNAGNNFKFIADGSAYKFYVITFNLMEGTYTIKGMNWPEFFYVIGGNGTSKADWNTSRPLRSQVGADGSFNGIYEGFYYLDGEFKFKPNAGDWTDDIEYSGDQTEGTASGSSGAEYTYFTGSLAKTDGGPNFPAQAGFFHIILDMNTKEYKLIPITSVGIIGDAQPGGWNEDTNMTWNADECCWEVTCELKQNGNIKFRGNDSWNDEDGNWGGSLASPINGSNENISFAEKTGNYLIKFYPSYDRNNKATVTAIE